MSVDLSDYVDTLRREVSPPGADQFAAVTDDEMAGYLADSFWEVKLDGFIEPFVCDADGIVTPVVVGTADIGRDQIALICLYAGIKIIRNKLMYGNTKFHAKAGPVEFSTENSANVLTEMLRELNGTKQRLLLLKTFQNDVLLVDAFSGRSTSAASYSGYLYDWFTAAFGSNVDDAYGVGPYGLL